MRHLPVQEYLRAGKTLDDLAAELSINVYRHPELPLVGLKYSQLDSPKTHPITMCCRGTVLDLDNDYAVVAYPFTRFFNAGEDLDNFRNFNWGSFTCSEKVDGSLQILYWYRDEWHLNTSGSFGLGEVNHSSKSWRELFWETSGIDRRDLDPEYCYIMELWTPVNTVVRVYPNPKVWLLSARHMPTMRELSVTQADEVASRLGISRPDHYRFGSFDEVSAFLRHKEETDKTFEGVVLRDDSDYRIKVKSESYLALAHLHDNGNIANPKRLVPLALSGEIDEVIAYFPAVRPYLEDVQSRLVESYESLRRVWEETRDIADQKAFALSIKDRTPFSSLLFNLRRDKGHGEGALRAKWRESADLIIKKLF